LLLLDLDDTLVDRAGAYRRWATSFAARHGRERDADWLVESDDGGNAPREQLAGLIRARFGLADVSSDALVDELRRGLVENMRLDRHVPPALDRARAAGWVLQVVTNGTLDQQECKLRRTGLDLLVDGWIVSGAVGLKSPIPGSSSSRHTRRAALSRARGSWGTAPTATSPGPSHAVSGRRGYTAAVPGIGLVSAPL
jgi:putative hydrolase of the HAD superfamily